DRASEDLKSIIGRDLTGLLTVARVSDNTLRVRLGAQNQAESRYAMTPRTHNITVVLLVPNEHLKEVAPTLQVVSRISFQDAEQGDTLSGRTFADTVEAVRNVLAKYAPLEATRKPDEDLGSFGRELLSLAQGNKYDSFVEHLHSKGWKAPYAQ